jgi:hypothetical protein
VLFPDTASAGKKDSEVDDPLVAAPCAARGDGAKAAASDLARFVGLDPGLGLPAAETGKRPGLGLDDCGRHDIDRVLGGPSRLEASKPLPFARELLRSALCFSSLRSGSLRVCHGAPSSTKPVSGT